MILGLICKQNLKKVKAYRQFLSTLTILYCCKKYYNIYFRLYVLLKVAINCYHMTLTLQLEIVLRARIFYRTFTTFTAFTIVRFSFLSYSSSHLASSYQGLYSL